MLNQFKNLSCYEEFEIQCTLTGISKVDVLKEIGHQICDYYFFVSDDGIFNWFDLNGNHIENPGVLNVLIEEYIPASISKCIIPDGVTCIDSYAFYSCIHLKKVDIPDSVICIDNYVFRGCKSLETITIPNNVTNIGYCIFKDCKSLKEVIFKGKTLDHVKQMKNYPFGVGANCNIIILC